jgi:hypothetical protein
MTMKKIIALLTLSTMLIAIDGMAENKNTVRGAIYIPAKAFNAPQMWNEYDPAVARRDMGYAAKINLNGVRIWLSYEYWLQNPDELKRRFDDFLAACAENGIRVYPSLFEGCGIPADTEATIWNKDPLTGMAIKSPHPSVIETPEKWGRHRKYISWFMNNYKDDERLLAIEVMNEPHKEYPEFARSMFKHAETLRGTRPLTIGTTGINNHKTIYSDLNLDIVQTHQNFPESTEILRQRIEEAVAFGKEINKPVWVSEWQRVRPGGSGFAKKKGGLAESEKYSDYDSIASVVQDYEVGTFFWSLMVKPAWLQGQRANGTINGLFFEDGAVWSLADARAIANDPTLELPERQIKDFRELIKFAAPVQR